MLNIERNFVTSQQNLEFTVKSTIRWRIKLWRAHCPLYHDRWRDMELKLNVLNSTFLIFVLTSSVTIKCQDNLATLQRCHHRRKPKRPLFSKCSMSDNILRSWDLFAGFYRYVSELNEHCYLIYKVVLLTMRRS